MARHEQHLLAKKWVTLKNGSVGANLGGFQSFRRKFPHFNGFSAEVSLIYCLPAVRSARMTGMIQLIGVAGAVARGSLSRLFRLVFFLWYQPMLLCRRV
jgi:hypothetical protein